MKLINTVWRKFSWNEYLFPPVLLVEFVYRCLCVCLKLTYPSRRSCRWKERKAKQARCVWRSRQYEDLTFQRAATGNATAWFDHVHLHSCGQFYSLNGWLMCMLKCTLKWSPCVLILNISYVKTIADGRFFRVQCNLNERPRTHLLM